MTAPVSPHRPPDHPPAPYGRVGVLLVNLGTPDAPDVRSVKRYLAEFLSDRRVVELPPLIWQPILRGIVLNTRPKKSAHAYAQVWDRDTDESPLRAITRAQAEALAARFGPQVEVDFAMRYGNPPIANRLAALRTRGCDRILVAPLYPQYSGATTASVLDKLYATLATERWHPAIRTLPPYHDDPAHIEALVASIEASLAALDFEPQLVLTSFHGMPQRTLTLGDPYYCQCHKTARLLEARLGWPEGRLRLTFQSRFGAAAWLQPYTDATLEALPPEGVRRVAVVAPGFAADCLETLEEVALRGRDSFMAAGGERFAYLPCLNATPGGIDMLAALIGRELEGWVPAA